MRFDWIGLADSEQRRSQHRSIKDIFKGDESLLLLVPLCRAGERLMILRFIHSLDYSMMMIRLMIHSIHSMIHSFILHSNQSIIGFVGRRNKRHQAGTFALAALAAGRANGKTTSGRQA